MRDLKSQNIRISGFSLIELCVVLVIVGLLLTGVLQFFKVDLEQKRVEAFVEDRHVIQKAIIDFITDDPLIKDDPSTPGINENDYDGQRYPCPADPQLGPGDAGYGVEVTVNANGTCKVSGGIKMISGPSGNIYVGSLPVVTLGLGSRDALDPYRRHYTYGVSAQLAVHKAMVNANAAGAIRIVNASGANLNATAQFIVLSHGMDGSGAYSSTGGTQAACTAGRLDTENCDNDTTFRSMEINLANGANYYDDSLFTVLGDDINDGWMQSTDTTQMHINTKNAGNFGIGTDGSTPSEKLEVRGGSIKTDTDVKADKKIVAGEDVEAGNAVKAKYFFYTD